MEDQKKQGTNLLALWQNLSTSRKISMAILVVSLITAFVMFSRYYSAPKMGLLFRGLSNDSASAVISRLNEMGIPYALGAGGQEIFVEESRINELRINLNSDGTLYGGGVGFELFDQTKLGVSESERRLNYQRALQGELQRTIAQIEGVNQSRVHLVIPEESVFIRETSAATASVVLQLNPLSRLRNDQVKGIIYLIAGSVANLPPENVAIIDTQGRILSDLNDDDVLMGASGATLKQLEIKRSYEKELELRLTGLLERVLGAGKVVAMVTTQMDFDMQDSTEISYGEPVLRSRSRSDEQFEGTNLTSGGIAGTESNIPVYSEVDAGLGESSYVKLYEIENYEVPEILVNSVKAPGKIQQISASVIYDNSRGNLTAQQMQQMENLVASALGISEETNSHVNIAAINFDTSHLEETVMAMERAEQNQRREMYIRYGLTALALLLGFFVLLWLLKRVKEFFEDQARLQPVTVSNAQPLIPQMQIEPFEENQQTTRVRNVTKQNPDTVISLLKMWLMDDQK